MYNQEKGFESRFKGWCYKCKKRYPKGTMIKKESGRYVHATCPTNGSQPFDLASAVNQAEQNSLQEEGSSLGSTEFTPSVFQEAIGAFVKDPEAYCKENGIEPVKRNAVVEAVAGSGKTTTIVWALNFTNPKDRVGFLAFNKHIAKELKNRQNLGLIPDHVHISTIHSLGLSNVLKLETKPKIDNDKISGYMDEFWPISKKSKVSPEQRMWNKAKRSYLRNVISLVKATLVDYENMEELQAMCERYNIDMAGDEVEVLGHVVEIMERCTGDLTIIDFDDMIYLCLVNDRLHRHMDRFDVLFVDECQDLNKAQIQFVMNSLQPGGRVVAVGDRMQSLYAFRGADTEAIPRMIEMLDAATLPLSISYRNPRKIVELAQKIVPQIQAYENAIEGEILTIKYAEFMNQVQVGDMVICRTNAPLVAPAFNLIRREIKAIIRGREIGEQLINFVNKFNADNIHQLNMLMGEFTEKEVERLLERGKELAADMALDKYETIKAVGNECATVFQLTEKLSALFSNEAIGVVLSSVHRAKGLEAKNIFVLRRDLLPHPKAEEEWELQQEQNIEYVAITRSKGRLIWVEQPTF